MAIDRNLACARHMTSYRNLLPFCNALPRALNYHYVHDSIHYKKDKYMQCILKQHKIMYESNFGYLHYSEEDHKNVALSDVTLVDILKLS